MRNCLGMEDFIREPVPPARIKMPVLPKPVKLLSSSSLVVVACSDGITGADAAGDDITDVRERGCL